MPDITQPRMKTIDQVNWKSMKPIELVDSGTLQHMLDESLHLGNHLLLCLDDIVGKLPDSRVANLGSFAGQNRDRVVGSWP